MPGEPRGSGTPAGRPTWREPWEVLAHDISPLPAGTALERLVFPLVRNLAHAVGGAGYAALWLPAGAAAPGANPAGWVPLLVCQARPDGRAAPASFADPGRPVVDLWDVPGVRSLTRI
nr:hypothetical protein [Micromonospora sp. DSM 115978]